MFKSEISPAYKVNLLFFILRYKCAIYAYAISASFFPHLSLCLSYDMSVAIYAYAISAFFLLLLNALCLFYDSECARVYHCLCDKYMLFLLAEGFLFLVLISLTVTFPLTHPRVRAWPLFSFFFFSFSSTITFSLSFFTFWYFFFLIVVII